MRCMRSINHGIRSKFRPHGEPANYPRGLAQRGVRLLQTSRSYRLAPPGESVGRPWQYRRRIQKSQAVAIVPPSAWGQSSSGSRDRRAAVYRPARGCDTKASRVAMEIRPFGGRGVSITADAPSRREMYVCFGVAATSHATSGLGALCHTENSRRSRAAMIDHGLDVQRTHRTQAAGAPTPSCRTRSQNVLCRPPWLGKGPRRRL